jgi:hypothetical protein
LWHYPLSSLAPIGKMIKLRRLQMIHLPKVTRLDPLSTLVELEELRIETLPSWDASGKTLVVESLKPLEGLRKLRFLAMAGVVAGDGDLSPLASLKKLEQLHFANRYSQEQLARLACCLPQATGSFLAPFKSLGIHCAKCGSEKVMLSGSDIKNPKVICPTCRRKKYDETVARFEKFRGEVRGSH